MPWNQVRVLIALSVAVGLCVPMSCQQEREYLQNADRLSGDCEAIAIYDDTLSTIRDARTLSYRSEQTVLFGADTFSQGIYQISMKKPNFTRIEAASLTDGCEVLYLAHRLTLRAGRNAFSFTAISLLVPSACSLCRCRCTGLLPRLAI